jgi:ParB family chromosome partitioning protein
MELARELRLRRERGYSHSEIAAKVNISDSYVSILLRLLDNGEERLIQAVERGEIPIAVAAEIAASDDGSLQQSLAEAYTSKRLRGKALLAARRLVEERRTRGKAMGTGSRKGKERKKVSADELVRTYRKEAQRQRVLAKKARVTELRLIFVANALKRLLADENFVNVLRAERLHDMPEYLADAVRRAA